MKNLDLFNKLAAQEDNFLQSDFLSPVLQGTPVKVRINNVILNLEIIRPKKFAGWGIFRPLSFKEAVRVRQPTMAEKQEYLKLFPALRFVLCKNDKDEWYGIPANNSDTRFKITGLVPIHFAEEVQLFDVIQARFDGTVCWFEGIYENHSLKNANYLREAFSKFEMPSKIELPGLTQEEKDAYLIAFNASEEAKKANESNRIKVALERAGATYRSHVKRSNSYTIEYVVDGETHKSVVNENLSVTSAGICLSGGDRAFDLQSLVSVVREGQNRSRIVRMGNNY